MSNAQWQRSISPRNDSFVILFKAFLNYSVREKSRSVITIGAFIIYFCANFFRLIKGVFPICRLIKKKNHTPAASYTHMQWLKKLQLIHPKLNFQCLVVALQEVDADEKQRTRKNGQIFKRE